MQIIVLTVAEMLLKPCNSDWDLHPQSFGWDRTPGSQDLMKSTFWVSHPGKNSVRDKVIGKKRIYLETHSPDRVWAISEGEGSTKVRGWQFLSGWEISQASEWELGT